MANGENERPGDSGSGGTATGCCFGATVTDNMNEFELEEPRKCTDVPWLISYVIFCCFMIIIAAFAFVYGNPYRLVNGMDSFGNICGTYNENLGNFTFSGLDMTEKPFVFFFDLQNMDKSTKICVSQCPEVNIKSEQELKEYYERTNVNLCRYDHDFDSDTDSRTKFQIDTIKADFTHRLCPKLPIYTSIPILKRCIPKPSEMVTQRIFFNVYSYLNSLNAFKQVLGDLAMTWKTILGFTALSFVISFIMVILVHLMTAVISYLILICSCLLSLGLTIFLWKTYTDIKTTLDELNEDQILEEYAKNERAFLAYSIISTIFTVGLFAIGIYLRKRVTIIVKLFRESGKALWAMPCLIIQPFITYLSLTIFFCIWLLVVLCLATADYPSSRQVLLELGSKRYANGSTEFSDDFYNETVPNLYVTSGNRTVSLEEISGITFIEYKDGVWIKYLFWVYILGLIWCSEFILSCQQFVIASSISTWYFSRDRKALKCVIFESIVRMLKYHIGSIVLGSLIITIVKLPRLILSFSHRVMRKWEKWNCIKFLYRCCTGCLNCFENTLKFIHHNAYTVVAIQGVDFCTGSKIAFAALCQNSLQVTIINSIGDFVLFLSKCIIASITGCISLIVFKNDETLYFYAIPVLLTVLFSYFVAHCVISVFEMTVDTLFISFCEDYNMNSDGTDGKQFYAPESLLIYMTHDAIDSVAPGRREVYAKKRTLTNGGSTAGENGKSQSQTLQDEEEKIPMNPTNTSTATEDANTNNVNA